MGEFAIRKSDGERVKIGTCEEMYYLRFEDRHKVRPESGNVDPVRDAGQLRFRLPFPDEDDQRPGEYSDFPFERGIKLYRSRAGQLGTEFFDGGSDLNPGSFQMHHPSGLLLNVPCYHGQKLPETGDIKAFWNGKDPGVFELVQVRGVMKDGKLEVLPVIQCRFCREKWRSTWDEVLDFVPEIELRARLRDHTKQEVSQ